jgi:putative Mg2+ transporter-C (MgtC) family protein
MGDSLPEIDAEIVTVVGRLCLALLLGTAIGIERQWQQKMAGLKTNALVALGAGGFVLFSSLAGPSDLTRVAAQVVSGIGFLGAGIIMREGSNIRGLNTAATLWCSAMVGTFAGGGLWRASIAAAALVVIANIVLRPMALRVNRQAPAEDAETRYLIELSCRGTEEARIRALLLQALSQAGLGLHRITSEDIPETSKVIVTAQTVGAKRNDAALEQIVGRLSLEPDVSAANWEVERVVTET